LVREAKLSGKNCQKDSSLKIQISGTMSYSTVIPEIWSFEFGI
jgi:hypothetical protein